MAARSHYENDGAPRLTISGASEPPLASCETASVLEHLWVRVDSLLTLGEGALMRLDARRLGRLAKLPFSLRSSG